MKYLRALAQPEQTIPLGLKAMACLVKHIQ